MLNRVSIVVFWTLSVAEVGQNSFPLVKPVVESIQANGITAAFKKEGLTLNLTAGCVSAERLCPFRAEIHAAPPLFDSITQVEYTVSPEPRSPRPPVTDASTRFRFEGRQIFGETVFAEVTLQRRGRTSTEVVRLEGTIPFAAEVNPPLPDGLRFENKYRRWYLEGGTGDYQYFRMRLRGEAAALNRIRTVEYQFPAANFSRPSVSANAFDEYQIDGTVSGGASFEIVAVIRWKSGTRSTHAIPMRAPIAE